MARAVPHLSQDQLSLFLAGELEPGEAFGLEAHLDVCESCRQLANETVRQRRAQEDALADTQQTDRTRTLPIRIGDVIDGRYRIERLLGVGGMGCVFEAFHVSLNQRVALKFMLPELARDGSAVDRFTREARAAVRLVTPHVGRVIDLGRLPQGVPYLVMEFLKGETVEQRLKREGPFARNVAVRVVREAIDALEEAHGQGIIHRDLKPANLFIAQRSNGSEMTKVLDFGIAKSIHPDVEAGLGSTSQVTLLGSPLYMAPEQLTGKPIDARVDVWALGCTLHQMLTSETPFGGADLIELMYSIRSKPHRSVADRHPALARVIDACLVKDPGLRLASVAELRKRLDAAEHEALAPVRKRRAPMVVAAATLVLLVGASVLALALRTAPPPPSAPPPSRPPVLVQVAPEPVPAPAAQAEAAPAPAPRAPPAPAPVVRKKTTDPLDERL